MGGIPYCLDRVPQPGTVRGKKQMDFQKADFLFPGRNYRVFGSAPFPGCGYGSGFLCDFLFDDRIYCLPHLDFRRPGTGLAFYSLYNFPGRRDTAFLHGILGEYLAKTYLETKHRPIYILKESSEEDDEERSRERNDEKTTDR